MSEINLDDSSEVIKSDKDFLTFSTQNNTSMINTHYNIEDYISITNITSDYIIVKIRSSKSKSYKISEPHFIMTPKEVKKIQITFTGNQKDLSDPQKHKFQIIGITIKEEDKDKDIRQLFKKYETGKPKGNLLRIKVTFTDEDIRLSENNINKSNKLEKIDEQESDIRFSEIIPDVDKIKDRKHLENLKKDYLILKEEVENLTKKEEMKKIELIQISSKNQDGVSDKFRYKVPKSDVKMFSKNTLISIFVFSMILGFYLVK